MLTPLLNRCSYKNSVALALIGSPGHGKTALIEAWCKANDRPLVKLLASCLDETDVAGIIVPKDGKAVTLSPQWLTDLGDNGVLFMDELNCFLGDVEILTDRGFVRFDELEDDAVVAQVDEEARISFVKPEVIHRIQYIGEMIRIHSKHVEMVMTPNHRVAYREFVSSPKYFRSFQPIKIMTADEVSVCGRPVYIPCGGKIVGSSRLTDKMKFHVAYAADGTFLYEHKKSDTIVVRFALVKKRKRVELERLCDSLGLSYTKSKEVDRKPGIWGKYVQYNVTVPIDYVSKNLCDVVQLGDVDSFLARELLVYLVKWDGTVTKEGGMSFTSTKKQDVVYVQALASLSACRSCLHTIEAKNKNQSLAYTIHITFQRDDYEILPRHISREGYSGMVYCVTVPSGMFIARYKKSTFVTGNCARKEVQDTLLTVIQSRHLPNGDRLPEGAMIIAAMNPAEMCDNYELSPAMRTRFMWCRHQLDMNPFAAWLLGQNTTSFSPEKYPAPKEHQTFEQWLELFRGSSEFEPDKKKLLLEAIKQGLNFTSDIDFGEVESATCPRTIANLFYWTKNAAEVVHFAPAFLDEKAVAVFKSIQVDVYRNVGNAVFKNTREQVELNEAENELLEQRQGLFSNIQNEVSAVS